MGRFIRDNQLEQYSKYEEKVIRPHKKKKPKQFEDKEESQKQK